MDTISLIDLGPVIAAVLGPMLAFVAVSMRYQHVDGTKTRQLITDSEKEARGLAANSREETRQLIANSKEETRELIANSEMETRQLIDQSNKDTRQLIERSNKDTRQLIDQSNKDTRQLIDQSNKETLEAARELIDGIAAGLAEHRRETREGFREVNRSLADTRERLARIEGHLGIGMPLPRPDGNAADAA